MERLRRHIPGLVLELIGESRRVLRPGGGASKLPTGLGLPGFAETALSRRKQWFEFPRERQ
jgi:hypothetical protein